MTDNDSYTRQKTRLNESSGPRIDTNNRSSSTVKIGPEFQPQPDPPFLTSRLATFETLYSLQAQKLQALQAQQRRITIELFNDRTEEGIAYETTPLEILKRLAEPALLTDSVVAKVYYKNASDLLSDPLHISNASDIDGNDSLSSELDSCCAIGRKPKKDGQLWDLNRALVGDCFIEILNFQDTEGKMVFWHSSAHVLGEAMEKMNGCYLTIGPPVEGGFYYDAYMGETTVLEVDIAPLEKLCQRVTKDNQTFQRLVLSKSEALDLFSDNVFKRQLIETKISDNGHTTAYRCGSLIDLCRGPHVLHTGKIRALSITKTSSTNWLGKTTHDSLQRVYGISFPSKGELKEYKHFQKEAAKRDHRRLGLSHELYFFHALSPGSAFWLPHGAHVYLKLLSFLQEQYRERGYTQVITPNMFNMELWNTSGHAAHYKENMFVFDVESQEFALKPMNCPSHCLMFDHRQRSYRELPIRYADFGVLHRNELSGALTGLTRVRRFQQDDAHIFCREDQIKQEIIGFLSFMKYIYDTFAIQFRLELSTRPEKALGDEELWNRAESQLASALDEFVGVGQWRENPGDGAFYGPKIDIMITDALKRQHQCATVQLDFQLPIRFHLKYRSDDGEGDGFKRPVIIHRAIYGSLERFIAVLVEHYAAKFPFWLSPRQILIVTVGAAYIDYAYQVKDQLFRAGFEVDIEDTGKTLNKKIREGQLAHYNFILVVGATEMETQTVNIRTRDNKVHGTKSIADAIAMFRSLQDSKSSES